MLLHDPLGKSCYYYTGSNNFLYFSSFDKQYDCTCVELLGCTMKSFIMQEVLNPDVGKCVSIKLSIK